MVSGLTHRVVIGKFAFINWSCLLSFWIFELTTERRKSPRSNKDLTTSSSFNTPSKLINLMDKLFNQKIKIY